MPTEMPARDESSRAAVIEKCAKLIREYNPILLTVDSFAAERLGKDCEGKNADPDKALIKQVFYGCITKHKPLKVFLTHFYGDLAAYVLRSDYVLYQIFAYLIIFRLEELGWEGLKAFVADQEPGKMFHILNYIFLGHALQKGVKQEWLDILDIDYIDNVIWKGLQRHRVEVAKLCASLEARAFGTQHSQQQEDEEQKQRGKEERPETDTPTKKKRTTVPKAPSLHPPRRRRVPMPLSVSNKIVIGEEPTYLGTSKSLEEILQGQDERRQHTVARTCAKYERSEGFKLHETRQTLEETKREVEHKRQATLEFDQSFVNPVPKYPSKGASVRLNAASILREDALFKKKQESEVHLLKAYEEDLRDCSEFYAWQGKTRAHDKAVQKARVEDRRSLAKASALEARLALERQRLDNKAYAEEVKKESELMQQQRQAEHEASMAMNKQLVKEVIEVREKAPKVAKEAVFKQHQRKSKAVREEKAAAWAKKLLEDEIAAEVKTDKIRRLKADHEVIRKQVKVFDPTTTSGLGFLNEISLMEAKERLAMNRLKEKEKEEARRQKILQAKAKKQTDLLQRLDNIKRLRQAATADAQGRKRDRRTADEEARERERVEREARQLEVLCEMEERRVAREVEQEAVRREEQRVRNELSRLQERMKLAHGTGAIGAEAEAQQKARQEEAEQMRRDARIQEIRAARRSRKGRGGAEGKGAPGSDGLDGLEEAIQEQRHAQAEEAEAKRRHVLKTRAHREALRNKLETLNPYAHKITNQSIRQAREARGVLTKGATHGTVVGGGGPGELRSDGVRPHH